MLAVDIGNTTTRLAAFSGGNVGERRVFPTRGLREGEIRKALRDLLGRTDGREAWIASVAPGANPILEKAAAALGLRPRFIVPGGDFIIGHSLENPRAAGVDRLLAAMAAGVRHFPGGDGFAGYAVIQCGSAATVDWVDGERIFRGGYILPGPEMWLSGLARAEQIPDYSGEPPDWERLGPGADTRAAVRNGLAAGLPAAVAAVCSRLACLGDGSPRPNPQSPARTPVVITGGWARAVAGLLPRAVEDADLLLYGIHLFAGRSGGISHG
ncbi:MAG: type III pantothenate kinase [Planctomycetota bacterium]|jgi:pantothenate kinase type III|nr:type III pantothenate kinase [Planctomycetota bacterium]